MCSFLSSMPPSAFLIGPEKDGTFYHIRIRSNKPEHMFMLHCLLVIVIICRKQHHNRALFVNVSKRSLSSWNRR